MTNVNWVHNPFAMKANDTFNDIGNSLEFVFNDFWYLYVVHIWYNDIARSAVDVVGDATVLQRDLVAIGIESSASIDFKYYGGMVDSPAEND